MKITPRTDTGLYVPVYRNESPEHSPEPYPVHPPQESWVNFWILSLLAIAAVGSLGLMWGWFKTPSQALTERNQKLEQQLAQTQADLETLKACLGK